MYTPTTYLSGHCVCIILKFGSHFVQVSLNELVNFGNAVPACVTSTEGPTHPVTFGWHLPFTFSTSGPLQACIDRHVHASTDVAEVFLFSHRFYREALRVDCKCIIIIKIFHNAVDIGYTHQLVSKRNRRADDRETSSCTHVSEGRVCPGTEKNE